MTPDSLAQRFLHGLAIDFTRKPYRHNESHGILRPIIGQHTWEALRDHLGFSEAEITDLAAAGCLS